METNQTAAPAIIYRVVFKVTGQVVGTYSTLKRARNAVDRKDNEYGAYGHSIRTSDGSFAI